MGMGESAGSGAGFVGAGALERHLAGQLTAALARPEAAATRDALAAAGEICREIAPRDALEKLLAVQMIAGHEAALDGYARARAAGADADPDSERARRAELRLAARLSAIFTRQAALLTRRRAQAERARNAERRAREAAERRAERTRAAARKQAGEAQAADAPQGGVLVVPHDDPDRPWPDPEAVAAALARKRPEAQGRAQAAPSGRAPGTAPGTAPEGLGYLLVPGTASPEDWNRQVREHQRRVKGEG